MMSDRDPIAPDPENIEQLEDRLGDLQEKREEIAAQLGRAERELREAQNEVADGGEVATATEAQSEHDALQGTLERLDEEIQAAEERLEKARKRLDERKRLQRLTEAAEEAGDAWGEYVEALENARAELRKHLETAASAKDRLNAARSDFLEDSGRSRGEVRSAAREIVGELDEEGRRGLARLVMRRIAGQISEIPDADGLPFDLSRHATHPIDRPELVSELKEAANALTDTR